ncbi:MAG: dihydropteroate synthase [Candidatus Omnitrophica bacterium]|nr:dihydropteroate synthase [Candidatus Omnitrophota bacterium]MCM8808273.1 dihydropteroate synthase [Candidatus Omnitrophota bacterium]
MIIIGERINGTRKEIKNAIEKRDREFIKKEVKKQKEYNAHYIDLNAGIGKGKEREMEDIKWLIECVYEVGEISICIDSSDPDVIDFGLSFVKTSDKMINSINGEKEKIEKMLPVIKKYPDSKIICLTMDENGIPSDYKKRVEIAEKLIKILNDVGIKNENIFVDCLIEPISVDVKNGLVFLKALKEVKEKFNVKTTCGLSNISFGLPKRKLINKYFLALCIYEGIDSVIIDPTIPDIREAICVSEMLTGKDEFCMNYIRGIREKFF